MKRFASLLLALAMVFAMSTTAFAATTTDGKITVKNTVNGTTYSIYRIFDLESFEGDNYSYKVSEKWENFFKTGAAGLQYVEINNGYVTWKEGASAADFAAAALTYAKTEATKITADATATSTGNNADVVFNNLSLGYYLVDSSLGALCALTTTDKEVEIHEKNAASSLEKQVKEDSNSGWGDVNDADIGQTVEFKATITVQGYTKDLVMHDKMDDGLTYDKVTKVTLNDVEVNAENYTVTAPGTDGCTFDVTFSETFCNTLKSGDVIVVYYQATLNNKAVVAEPENNSAHLSYKDESGATHTTIPDTTKTYTWDMEVLKYANGVESNVLAGVKFVLLNSDRTKVATVDANGKFAGWETVPTAGSDNKITWPATSVLTTGTDGKIHIDGLDADTYYLREIEALPGYNILNEDQQIPITGKTDGTYTTYVAKINNQSGAELPSTGGMGTTLFYVLGGALVIGAAVLLVVKRRMNGAER